MKHNEIALAYLNRNKLLYLNMLEVLRRGSGPLLYAGEDGVLLYDGESRAFMLSARDRAGLEKQLPLIPPDCRAVVGHEMWYRDELAERFGLWRETPCVQAAWMSDTPPELPAFGGELRRLGMEWAGFINDRYTHGGPEVLPAVEKALRRGMLGAFVDGEMAGFVGFHSEGSIGFLEVLPPYRRRGLGEALLLGAVRMALEEGQYAFAQVFEDNDASLGLHRKVGMTLSEETMYWLFREEI